MADLTASVLIPTTGDRGSLLRLSVGSVLAQTVADLEVLVVGDGAGRESRRAIEELREGDARVRFFDFPKDVSRGEVNRHRVLTDEARGRIVCYLCDRDLYLRGHVEEMAGLLEDADLAHTLRFRIEDGDRISVPHTIDLDHSADRRLERRVTSVLPLSLAGHTIEMYRRLPFGWRETPPGLATDRYMWSQFLEDPSCRVGASPMPTVLTFTGALETGWASPEHRQRLEAWARRTEAPDFAAELAREVWEELLRDRAALARELRESGGPAVLRWVRGRMSEDQYAAAWSTAERVLPERLFQRLSRSG